MKKYFQITFFIGIFALLVFIKQFKGDEAPVVQKNSSLSQPTATPTVSDSSSGSTQGTTSTATPTTMMQMMGQYKNGTYTGKVTDAFYGNIQVQAIIKNGKISDVIFLQAPNDNGTSISINSQADPMLTQEAIQAQSANVDTISGASASSDAFKISLADALSQAK